MPATLIQAALGGSAVSTSPGNLATATPTGFPNATVAGNLLILIVWGKYKDTTINHAPGFPAPSTPGFTWTRVGGGGNGGNWFKNAADTYQYRSLDLFYILNAASMATSVLTTVSAGIGGTTATETDVEFTLLEFAGTTVFIAGSRVNGSSGTPAGSVTIPSGVTALVLAGLTSESAHGAGAGYTLGPNGIVATSAQVEYQAGVAAGVRSIPFTGTSNNWALYGAAFQDGTVAPPVPILQVAPLTQAFAATEGGVNPASQNIAVANGNGGTLNWTVASDQSWLTALPVSGTDAGVVAASVSITGLVAGVYTGHLTFTAVGATGSPQVVTVTLTITPAATALLVAPTALSFTAELGTGNPASQSATVSNTGTPGTMNFTLTTNQAWLTVTPTSGNAGITPVALTVSTDVTGLAVGVYNATATITATGAVGSPRNITATLTITAPPLPPPVILQSKVLTQADTWELDNGLEDWGTDTGTPFAWHETTLPQQQIAIAPTPDDVGQIGLLYIALARTLDGTGIALTVPDDWAPYIVWGVLSELLGSDGPSYDPVRAAYCERRFNEGIELARLVLGG